MIRRVCRLDAAHRADFYRLHNDANDCGWCCCIAWWVPTWEGFGERTAEENRRLRDELFDKDEYDIYMLYVDGTPMGSCQAGLRDRLPKLVKQYGLIPDPEAWAVTCFQIAPAARGQGHAAFLLSETLGNLRARGARRVEAFPKRGPDLDVMDVWTGPEGMYRGAGFIVIRDDPSRPVLSLTWPGAD